MRPGPTRPACQVSPRSPCTYPAPGSAAAAGNGGCRSCTRAQPAAGPQAQSCQRPGCPGGRPGSAAPGHAGPGAVPLASGCGTVGGRKAEHLHAGSAAKPPSALGGPWGWPTVTRDQERMSCRSRQKLCHARRLFMSTCSWCQSATRAWCWASSLAGQGAVRGTGAPTHCHPLQRPDPRPPTW